MTPPGRSIQPSVKPVKGTKAERVALRGAGSAAKMGIGTEAQSVSGANWLAALLDSARTRDHVQISRRREPGPAGMPIAAIKLSKSKQEANCWLSATRKNDLAGGRVRWSSLFILLTLILSMLVK
jgi:hypothetical protein